jgi:hypothetical protein
VILDRDARHGLDTPTLTFSDHRALVVWRRFSDELHRPAARVLELSSVSRAGVASARQELTGPPNGYDPAFPTPQLLTFARRKAAYVRAIEHGRPGVTTRLPAGAAIEAQVAPLPDGTLVTVWPNAGAVYAATQAPGALAFGAAIRLSAAGGFARSPQLAVTPHGDAVVLWTQSGGARRALVSAARPPGGTFAAPVALTSSAAQALAVRAISTIAGDVFVSFVSARPDVAGGPLRGMHVGPDGRASTPLLTLTPPGEHTKDAALAVDSGAAYAAWVTAGRGPQHRVRVVRVAGSVVGTVRSLSRTDVAVTAPPALAMTTRGRAMLAYMVRSGGVHLVTRRAG